MKTKIIYSMALVLMATGVFAQDKNATKPAPEKKAAPTVQPAKTAPAVQIAPAGNTPGSTVGTDAAITFDQTEYNFGNVEQGKAVNYDFKFTNTGKSALIISNATGSCGCTVPDWPKEPIKAGGTGVIKVTFNSAGKSGMQDKTVTITSNANGSPHTLHIKGNVDLPTGGATQPAVNTAPAKVEPAKK